MKLSENPQSDEVIREFLSQFPQDVDLQHPQVLNGIKKLLEAQGFTKITTNTNRISGYFGDHIFHIWRTPDTTTINVSYVTSAYDRSVHHLNYIPIDSQQMTFWEYLWDLGRILNRSLELVTSN